MADLGPPYASLESEPRFDHVVHFQLCPEIRVTRTEENGLGEVFEIPYTYRNEPGIIDVYTSTPFYLQHEGPEYIRKTASFIMKELVWGKVSPGSGVAESVTILGVTKQRVNQL